MTLIEAINDKAGTATEMQLRMLLAAIRKAADNGEEGILYKKSLLGKVDLTILVYDILRDSGFETDSKLDSKEKNISIAW